MMFEGSKFCPHCGAKSERSAASATEMPCPKCDGKKLAQVQLGETTVSECESCHGLWVEASTFDSICVDRERQSTVLGAASSAFIPGQRSFDPVIKYVRCPHCRCLMHRVNFAKCSGVIIDTCKGHGCWFDRDELQHIVEFIRTGGLDLSRAREKAELEAARRRLQAAQSDANSQWGHRTVAGEWAFTESDLFDIAGSISDIFR